VQPNDTLSGIAAHFHTSVSALVRLNAEAHPSLRFNPDRLIIGWKLKVHGTPVRVAQKSYTVKQNDTLGKIAGKFHTSVTQLIAWNVHEHPTLRHHADHIEAGWKLRVS
jgi:peptidoglycan endopeptidase LytE